MEVDEVFDPIGRFEDFLKNYVSEEGVYKYREAIRRLSLTGGKSVIINFEDLCTFDPKLSDWLLLNPDEGISAASKAVKNVLMIEDPDYAQQYENFYARFSHIPEKILLRGIRSEHAGKLVAIDGILTRASEIRPLLVRGCFECKCGERVIVEQNEIGKMVTPDKCPSCKSKGSFRLIVEESKFIDWQKIRIQERPEDLPPGQLPRFLDAYLLDDLVDKARPGDRVTLIGILRIAPETSQRRRTSTFKMYLDVNNIEIQEKELEEMEITPEDEKKILELAKDPWIHKKIVRSIAPSIYGYEDVKKAIALMLFGGVPKTLPDGTRIRGDSNILLIGDPGTAKSQLLKYVATIAPRGIYTSGKGTTAAGLTAAVIKDSETGGLALEAGALVLADMGVVCIDEFDKMEKKDRVALHEAMEQQTISIAKAGIVATLNARCAILAAANPKLGRYDPYRSVADNIDLPVTLLSRFDLIFILTDRPSIERDKQMVEHILALHMEEGEKPPIPPDLLKKYILYARKHIKPVLTKEAAERIEQFYLELRKMSEGVNSPVAITPRQLESLIRLAEAHAKMALRDKVTVEDAEEAIRLMMASLKQVGYDQETGQIDIDLIMTGHSRSQRDRLSRVLDIIEELEMELGRAVPIERVIERAKSEGISEEFVKEAIDKLRRDGLIFEPKQGYVKKVS
ncbi:MAG: minichromosome maintenance protein MCM [Candidatus Baldrarchaeia archaeon]